MEGRHRWSAVQFTGIALSNEILCASQQGLNIRGPFIEYSMSAFDILITCRGKDNMDLEKTKRKRQFSSLGGKNVSKTCCK